jgi:hypothetical protein
MSHIDSLPTLADHPHAVRQKWDADEHSRVEDARARAIADESHWRAVCQHVNQRDGYCCRVCGRRCDPGATTMLDKGHHHHIVLRSAGGLDTPENVVLLDADCHDAVHVKKTLAIEGNAEEALTVRAFNGKTGEWFVHKQEVSRGVWERD